MAQVESNILAAGAQIVWVLTTTRGFQPATAADCRSFMDAMGSSEGLCVGDGETEPTPGVWARSPFAVGRGFDLLVERASMRVRWVSPFGTPAGNENLDGAAVLEEVRRLTGR